MKFYRENSFARKKNKKISINIENLNDQKSDLKYNTVTRIKKLFEFIWKYLEHLERSKSTMVQNTYIHK
jgi:hypothetical protein